nr:ORF3 [Torque teno felis virus]
MPYGERCRVTSKLKAWCRTPKDLTNHPYQKIENLKPANLVRKNADARSMKQIFGPETSTQTGSSQKELLEELLDIVQEMSSLHWKNDLSLSMTSSTESSQTEDSSSESDYEILEPPLGGPPPKEAPDHPPLKYCPF